MDRNFGFWVVHLLLHTTGGLQAILCSDSSAPFRETLIALCEAILRSWRCLLPWVSGSKLVTPPGFSKEEGFVPVFSMQDITM